VKILVAVLAALVLAGAGFAGGWFARSPSKRCYVLPAYTSQSNDYLPKPSVNPPELVCK
jgi:hypothetical protein